LEKGGEYANITASIKPSGGIDITWVCILIERYLASVRLFLLNDVQVAGADR
jgi:hypothetical protein